jgi:hypothetical protein
LVKKALSKGASPSHRVFRRETQHQGRVYTLAMLIADSENPTVSKYVIKVAEYVRSVI